MTDLRVLTGGAESPTYLLLHGLGATAEVWEGLAAQLGDAAWVAPDLPGHGGSSALPSYSFAGVAAAVAGLVDPLGTVIVGHSFGGVIGLHLAGRPGVLAVIGLGIKVSWTEDELAKAAALAERPAPAYATREEAARRHAKVAGLDGDAPASAVTETPEGWRPTFDQRAFAVGDPHVAALLELATVPVLLARGEHDHMVTAGQIADLGTDPIDLPGLGHNAHVERPEALLPLLATAHNDRVA
ncbi:alpha/beta fold hydrolase [Actinoplanes solisilvae]|uniref:alpha/beta fold hydrolase n=1 Tax=Actinoplanes solisilvae TaxID=2486853 RepID=UPI000FD8ADF6|nr:alpha/beta hydrolase [Actinoplanes solisilvae]